MKTVHEWQKECEYINKVTIANGMVPEMNFCKDTFIRYCIMQQEAAERDKQFDAAAYIELCINDLEGF